MNRLDPEKLTVEFMEGVTDRAPIIPRRYTLTHSDIMGDLYLTIGPDFVFDKVRSMRDEVLGEWLLLENGIRYNVYLHMDGEFGQGIDTRNDMLRRELPLALQAIRYGDRRFFDMHPEMDKHPIIVYFLYANPEQNKAEDWGIFADYGITAFRNQVMAYSIMEYHVLIDEKIGDVTGDGVPDRVSLYGDKLADSDYINNIIIEIEYGQTEIKTQIITEVNGYNPTLFLGDFTKDKIDDILFNMDSKDKGSYGVSVDTYRDKSFETIFSSDMYNDEYRFIVEYNDFYKVSVLNVRVNRLFFLDISYKGYDYLSQYYNEDGQLIKPAQGEVLGVGKLIPVVSNMKNNSFDLLAVHRIIGFSINDTLGYIKNLISWDGKQFATVSMMVCTPGTYLIPPN